MRKRKVIISVAPVSGGILVNSDELAMDILKSVKAGAAMCHLHSRTPKGELTSDTTFIEECFNKIKEKTDVVVQVSTGGVSQMNIVERCAPLEYHRAESASLNGGTTNLGELVYINSFEDIRFCAQKVYDHGIIPEIEVFDIGMINNIMSTKQEVDYREPLIFNLVFGHKGGMQPTIESLTAFRSFVPEGALWGVTHFGRDNWSFLAAAIAMGASIVRIGFEDSPYLSENKTAEYNYELVERLAHLVQAMDFETATPKEARKILGI
ncbi:MAG TPA: 3-keto-5-aminohexanoate cleavage protein [Candidatus Merdenecus merdavium]|nr:3-keto-5-aminohexanoate cleavage protein [Candidatus Merdenecus merdavium]